MVQMVLMPNFFVFGPRPCRWDEVNPGVLGSRIGDFEEKDLVLLTVKCSLPVSSHFFCVHSLELGPTNTMDVGLA